MNISSLKADRDSEERKETGEFLFMSVYSNDNPEELIGMIVGEQLKKFEIIK